MPVFTTNISVVLALIGAADAKASTAPPTSAVLELPAPTLRPPPRPWSALRGSLRDHRAALTAHPEDCAVYLDLPLQELPRRWRDYGALRVSACHLPTAPAKAREIAAALIDGSPSSSVFAPAHLVIAHAWLADGDWAGAAAAFEQASPNDQWPDAAQQSAHLAAWVRYLQAPPDRFSRDLQALAGDPGSAERETAEALRYALDDAYPGLTSAHRIWLAELEQALSESPHPPAPSACAIYAELLEQDLKNSTDAAPAWLLYGSAWCADSDEDALSAYRVLLEDHEESPLAPAARLGLARARLGLEGAEATREVFATLLTEFGPEHRLHGAALVAHAEWLRLSGAAEESIEGVRAYLDQRTDTTSAALDRAAFLTLAGALISAADTDEQAPVESAESFTRDLSDPGPTWELNQVLAEALIIQRRYAEAIAVLEHNLERWPLHSASPGIQWRIATLYQSLSPPDAERSQQILDTIESTYAGDTAWAQANKGDTEALRAARGFRERILAQRAFKRHSAATQSGQAVDYLETATHYTRYLDLFPEAEDAETIHWWLGDVLLRGEEYDRAQAEFEWILREGSSELHLPALFQLFSIQRKLTETRHGSTEERPEDAQVEREVATLQGGTRAVYALSSEHARLVELCDALASADTEEARRTIARLRKAISADPLEEVRVAERIAVIEPFAEAVDDSRHKFAYLAAQILVEHGRFEQALPRLKTVIERWPEEEEAIWSASLIVDAFILNEDFQNVISQVRLYSHLHTQPTQEIEEGAAFKIAESLTREGRRLEAALMFDKFQQFYPDSRYHAPGLYNAAHNYALTGQTRLAIELFEAYVDRYPDDERTRPLYFRIADLYADTSDLENAIRYYEALYEDTAGRGEDYADAPAALYNAGYLRIGLGDYDGAATSFERYATEHPDLPDTEAVFFSAGEHWERVGDTQNLAFYRRYVERFGDQNPDHLLEALYHIARLTEQSGETAGADRAWDALSRAYDRLEPSGSVGSIGRHYAAHATFRTLQARLDAFTDVVFNDDERHNAELLNRRQQLLPQLDADCTAAITRFHDFETSSAFLYTSGIAFLSYADMLRQAPPPREFTEDEDLLGAYIEQIDELAVPVENKGKKRLTQSIASARELNLWSDHQTRSLEELNRRYPGEFTSRRFEANMESQLGSIPTGAPWWLPPEADSDQDDSALALLRSGGPEEILQALERLQALPSAPQVTYNIGLAHHLLGDLPAAQRDYLAVAQAAPAHPDSWLNLGALAEIQGRPAVAALYYRAGLRYRPGRAELEQGLSRVLGRQGLHDEARTMAIAAITRNPLDVSARVHLARTYRAAGDLNLAQFTCQGALERLPEAHDSAELRAELGRVFQSQDRPLRARQEFTAALELDPDLLEAHLAMARIHLDNRDFESALLSLERARKQAQADPAFWNNLGVAYRGAGRDSEAEEAYRRALDLAPWLTQPRTNLAILLGDHMQRYADAAEELAVIETDEARAWREELERQARREELLLQRRAQRDASRGSQALSP